MTTKTKFILATAKAPTSRGTFEGLIDFNPPEGDSDNERIGSWANVPGKFPLLYQHTQAQSDPGAEIGNLSALPKGDNRHLLVLGRLDLSNPMAVGVHERMLLPANDAISLGELSVGFSYDTSKVYNDDNGVKVIPHAELLEVSVVYRGAQSTSIRNVKTAKRNDEIARLNALLDGLATSPIPAVKSGAPDVDAFIHSESKRREAERAAKQALDSAIERVNVTGNLLPSEADRDESERERFERERILIEQRDEQRRKEADARKRADEARRLSHVRGW